MVWAVVAPTTSLVPGTLAGNYAGVTGGAAVGLGGGANVLFGDGSVKFIKSTIGYPTWWSLGTRSGGEVVGSDSY